MVVLISGHFTVSSSPGYVSNKDILFYNQPPYKKLGLILIEKKENAMFYCHLVYEEINKF